MRITTQRNAKRRERPLKHVTTRQRSKSGQKLKISLSTFTPTKPLLTINLKTRMTSESQDRQNINKIISIWFQEENSVIY